MGLLKTLTRAIKRRVDPKTRTMLRVGYLNSELERTNVGIHQILNFIEEKFGKEFVSYLEELEAEFEEEDKKDCGD